MQPYPTTIIYTLPEMMQTGREKSHPAYERESFSNSQTSQPLHLLILLFFTSMNFTDQWSPVNPEGKKQYGRDFLLQFQPECKDKPDGLPHIPDIVLDKVSNSVRYKR